MTLELKTRLLESLAQTHSNMREALTGIDLELAVYPESGWRIRDILGHIATWDRQVAMSLRAFRVGQEYALPEHDETAFNEQDVLNQQELTTEQVLREWDSAREDFKEAVDEIPLDMFPGDLLYPWGDERGTIAFLVESMTEHDVEHQDEVVEAIRRSRGE